MIYISIFLLVASILILIDARGLAKEESVYKRLFRDAYHQMKTSIVFSILSIVFAGIIPLLSFGFLLTAMDLVITMGSGVMHYKKKVLEIYIPSSQLEA